MPTRHTLTVTVQCGVVPDRVI